MAARSSLNRYNSEDHPLSAHKLAAAGYHAFHCLGVPFHVKKRYTFLRELGIGAYGCVALAHDSVLDCNVAIKKVTRVFEREVLARRALREVAILREIGPCDNVTALLDFDTTFIELNEIYLVLEASEADLSQIIRSGQALSDAHLQYFIAQILRGVRYMHAARIIHRDMKPGNLLVNGDCQLKLCDFGLARAYRDRPDELTASMSEHVSPGAERTFPESPHLDRSQPASPSMQMNAQTPPPSQLRTTALDFPGGPLTEYVATRWYRAPEIMLCFKRGYGPAIDIWSVGCILAELLGGKPLFAGKDYVDQIARINNVLGSPPQSTIDKIGSERAKTYVESLPQMPIVPFAQLYPKASPSAIDLLTKMLCWDPEERISAADALQHPWLKAYHRSNNNWTVPPPFDRFDEVEMLTSIADFRGGLEREADEMRAELEALESEEMQALEQAARRDVSPSNEDRTGDDGHREGGKDGDTSLRDAHHCHRTDRDGQALSPSAFTALVPSPLSSSGISPTYETDLTSVSAPHSVAGSHSAGKTARVRAVDGLGLSSNTVQDASGVRDRGREALDKRLASQGLLCGDEDSRRDAASNRKTCFRRRAVSNAPSQETCLRRRGSEGHLHQRVINDGEASAASSSLLSAILHSGSTTRAPTTIMTLDDVDAESGMATVGVQASQSAGIVEDVIGGGVSSTPTGNGGGNATAVHDALHNQTKSTDIIRRSALQRECHRHVADEAPGLLNWLWKSSSPWSVRPAWMGGGGDTGRTNVSDRSDH